VEIEVDRERCTGHGRCYALAPEVFDPDDGGYSVVRMQLIPAGLEQAARRAAANCPEDAITVLG
jgi:ferredoxin